MMQGGMQHEAVPTSVLALAGKWASACVASIWVGIPLGTQGLMILMAMDYPLGLAVAWKRRELCARRGLEGLVTKGAMLLIVFGLAAALKKFGFPPERAMWLATGFAFNEGISITTNAEKLGVPIPRALIDRLQRAKEEIGWGKRFRKKGAGGGD